MSLMLAGKQPSSCLVTTALNPGHADGRCLAKGLDRVSRVRLEGRVSRVRCTVSSICSRVGSVVLVGQSAPTCRV